MERLQTARAVHMTDSRHERAFFRTDLEYLHHKRNVIVLFEPFQPLFRSATVEIPRLATAQARAQISQKA